MHPKLLFMPASRYVLENSQLSLFFKTKSNGATEYSFLDNT